MYNTASMLRTMELMLGLRPMTQFDAAARPMSAAFQTTPIPRRMWPKSRGCHWTNGIRSHSATAARSSRMDFAEADQIDDDELNDILWRHRKGVPALLPRGASSRSEEARRPLVLSVTMPRIYLCFLWHMHQPFYKDLVSGEYKLALDPPACLKGLLRHGQDSGGISESASDIQPGAFHDGAGRGVCARAKAAIRFWIWH